MFELMKLARARRNVELFVEHVDRDPGQADHLSTRYFRGLHRIQRYRFPHATDGSGPLLVFDLHRPDLAEAVLHFMQIPEVDRSHACSSDEQEDVRRGMAAGLALLGAHDPELRAIVDLVIGTIFFAKLEGHGGGSMGGTSGLVWLNPADAMDDDEYAAKLLHELTHQCLFLHEMVHTMFAVEPARMSEDDMLVTSALLHQRRGYARSFHSACVAARLVHYYDHRGLIDRATPAWQGLLVTAAQLREIADRTRCLTAGGEEVLVELERFIRRRQA